LYIYIGQGYFDEWALTYGKRRDRNGGKRKKNGVLDTLRLSKTKTGTTTTTTKKTSGAMKKKENIKTNLLSTFQGRKKRKNKKKAPAP